MENKISTNNKNGNDANRLLADVFTDLSIGDEIFALLDGF